MQKAALITVRIIL